MQKPAVQARDLKSKKPVEPRCSCRTIPDSELITVGVSRLCKTACKSDEEAYISAPFQEMVLRLEHHASRHLADRRPWLITDSISDNERPCALDTNSSAGRHTRGYERFGK